MPEKRLSGLDVLIVEDDPLLSRRLAAQLERLGADVSTADTLAKARTLCATLGFDFVLLDVNLPDGLGTDWLAEKSCQPGVGVIVMTAHGGVSGAVEAMRLGALDYLVKPFEPEELPLVMERARRAGQSARREAHRREDAASQSLLFGRSLAGMQTQLEKILAADRRLRQELPPVLIQGETGTGKSTIARWLHQQGPRATEELVEVNCSALPETLAESELFGHERGAFTDARNARMGLFEAAHEGTLFLDEIPSLPLPLQAKVLTAIEDRKIRRVGGNKPIPVEVRIIAATQCDLRQLVAQGQFREDLFHRLDLYRIAIPPLRERGDDILQLATFFCDRLARKHRAPARKIAPAGRERLLAYPWPGNVRELAHEIERALVFEDAPELQFLQLSGAIPPGSAPGATTAPDDHRDWLHAGFQFPPEGFALETAIDRLMHLALDQAGGNVSAAARLLGVPRDYIRYRVGRKGRPADGN